MKLKFLKYKSVKSTNNKAINHIKSGKIKPCIILSSNQTKGRGRYGRRWVSQKGNIFFSVFFEINPKKKISYYLKKNVMFLKKILSKYINENITIKFPNDLLIKKQKVCGILQETIFYGKKKFLIIGVGLNTVKSPLIPAYPTTYLFKYKKKKINNLLIINDIKRYFEKNFL